MLTRRTPTRRAAASRPRRNGFTLVELLVAVVLIEIALLALVATGASLVRETTATRARFDATNAAANRLQLLGDTPCASTNGVSNGATGLVERWSADVTPNHVREISDSVTFVATGSTHVVALRTRLPC